MEIRNNFLKQAYLRPSPNAGGELKPKGIIIHYTAGASANGAISWMQNPSSQVSCHLVIDRQGNIFQLVEFNRIAWHAGQSRYKNLSNLNNHTIGIELDNMGLLKWINKKAVYTPTGTILKPSEYTVVKGQPWHNYTKKQIDTCREVSKFLISELKLSFIAGHNEVAPTRKIDPGALFDMNKFRKEIGL